MPREGLFNPSLTRRWAVFCGKNFFLVVVIILGILKLALAKKFKPLRSSKVG